MSKQDSVLAFILSQEGPTINYERLNNVLLNAATLIEKHGGTPFNFIHHQDQDTSFVLEHALSSLEKKGLIKRNGAIQIEQASFFSQKGRELQIEIQLKLLSLLESTPHEFVNSSCYYSTQQFKAADCDCIFTVGYEGKDLDSFLTLLLKTGISRLVDVRQNAVSRKFGFSKKQLTFSCESLGIDYVHVPELGIPSEDRQSLKTQKDYDDLFRSYTDTILAIKDKEQLELLEMIDEAPSVLMCYEANPKQCHRTHLAKSLSQKSQKPVRKI